MSRSCPDSSRLFKNLMTIENWYNITNSWIASFPGKIMYRKGQKKRNMSAFYLLTFYGPLWWKCPLLPDFGSTLFFKLVECWSNSRVHPFSCALRHKVLREVKLQGLSHKNYLERSEANQQRPFAFVFVLVLASILTLLAPSSTLTDFASVCHCSCLEKDRQ